MGKGAHGSSAKAGTEMELASGGVGPVLFKDEDGLGLGIAEHFHMSWYAMIMGWGGVALAVNGVPAGDDWRDFLHNAGTVIWFWDLILLGLFSGLLLTRIVSRPSQFWAMLAKPGESLFFGCIPMGISVVGMGFSTFGTNMGMSYKQANDGAQAFFWIQLLPMVLSLSLIPWLMVTQHQYKLESMPSTYLLPFVSAVVASALCGVTGPHQHTLDAQMEMNIAGYVLWGLGMLCAGCIIPVYICRLFLHGVPPAGAGNSVWVILGPVGQGANAIMMLGRHTGVLQCTGHLCTNGVLHTSYAGQCFCDAHGIPSEPVTSFGFVMPGVSLLIGIFLWGFGLFAIFIAGATSLSHTKSFNDLIDVLSCKSEDDTAEEPSGSKGMPFNVPWWGVVFPMVTITMATYQLNTDTGWRFFRAMAQIYCVVVVLTALYIHIKLIINLFKPSFWHTFHPKTD